MQKCIRIVQSTCHQQSSTMEFGYTAEIAFICALSQLVIITAGKICGLCNFTKFKKYLIVASVLLNVNIQATGTPVDGVNVN